MEPKSAMWSDYMYQNLVEVIACVIPNSTITLSKVYTRRTIENGLIRNAKVNSKQRSQTGKQMITIRMLPHISRRKNNQAMKFGQLSENKMRNIFLKKSYVK